MCFAQGFQGLYPVFRVCFYGFWASGLGFGVYGLDLGVKGSGLCTWSALHRCSPRVPYKDPEAKGYSTENPWVARDHSFTQL